MELKTPAFLLEVPTNKVYLYDERLLRRPNMIPFDPDNDPRETLKEKKLTYHEIPKPEVSTDLDFDNWTKQRLEEYAREEFQVEIDRRYLQHRLANQVRKLYNKKYGIK